MFVELPYAYLAAAKPVPAPRCRISLGGAGAETGTGAGAGAGVGPGAKVPRPALGPRASGRLPPVSSEDDELSLLRETKAPGRPLSSTRCCVVGEKSITASVSALRLLRRSTTVPRMKTARRTKRPAVVKTATIAVLLWKKVTAPVEDEDCRGGGVGAWEAWKGCTLVMNVVVGVSLGVVTTIGVELGRSVPERVEDVVGIEEGAEELAAGELVADVPVVVPLLRLCVERNGFVATQELTVYRTRVQKGRFGRMPPSPLNFEILMRVGYH